MSLCPVHGPQTQPDTCLHCAKDQIARLRAALSAATAHAACQKAEAAIRALAPAAQVATPTQPAGGKESK